MSQWPDLISPSHNRMSSLDSTASDESSSIPTPSGHNYYGSVSSLISGSAGGGGHGGGGGGRENLKDHYGSITSLASSTSLISPQVCVDLFLGSSIATLIAGYQYSPSIKFKVDEGV